MQGVSDGAAELRAYPYLAHARPTHLSLVGAVLPSALSGLKPSSGCCRSLRRRRASIARAARARHCALLLSCSSRMLACSQPEELNYCIVQACFSAPCN